MKYIRFDSLPSTNDLLMDLGRQGAESGTVVIAETQSAGKGTKGRSFSSKRGGIYMSLLLRGVSREHLPDVTPAAAVAVMRAIEKCCGVKTKIKPVNDLYLDGKKVCGILTQASSSGPEADFIVVGVGINLFPPEGGFDESIKDTAGFLIEKEDPNLREELICSVAVSLENHILGLSDEQAKAEILKQYNSNLTDKPISDLSDIPTS